MKNFIPLITILLLSCKSNLLPSSIGEKYSTYAYIPIDPLPVSDIPANSCQEGVHFKELRYALPDQVARLAVSEIDINGNITYGPVGISSKNNSYQVNFDYASSDVARLQTEVKRIVTIPNSKQNKKISREFPENPKLLYKPNKVISVYDKIYKGASRYEIKKVVYNSKTNDFVRNIKDSEIIVFPIYIGFGVRLTATIKTSENKLNISSLSAISAGVNSGKISGTLVTQTLGVTGEDVRSTFPIQSEINQSTIQQALISLGSIKTLVNDKNAKIEPRVLGFYSPIGINLEIINKVIAELSKEPLKWNHPCVRQ